ncbi:MAG: uncharacterized protein V7633_595 [Pseudonocardia sp.]
MTGPASDEPVSGHPTSEGPGPDDVTTDTSTADGPRPGPVARVLIGAVRFYQHWISPALPPTCRFYPSCSAYAVEAVQVHGALRGTGMAVLRLLRCGPWHPGGVDPVPERRARAGPGPAAPADPAAGATRAHHEPHDCARNCEEQAPC